jgi:hypothetical protein
VEVEEIEKEISQKVFRNKIKALSSVNNSSDFNSDLLDLNLREEDIYDVSNEEPRKRGIIKDLVINLGSSDLARIVCANHKLGNVINSALAKQMYLLNYLKELSASNDALRCCLKTNNVFRNLKCRTRIYQKTRWTGAILLLFSNQRAYHKGAFDEDIICPIGLDVIETYIQILLPAYYTTLGWEKNKSSIADVIPQVKLLENFWNKISVSDPKAKELCYFLIHFLRINFKYELESSYYKVNYLIFEIITTKSNY